MKETKFRGKRIDNDEWVFGSLFIAYSGEYFILLSELNFTFSGRWFEVNPKTVGQLVGLKDKVEKEYYQGDIADTDQGFYFIKEILPYIVFINCKNQNDSYDNGDYYQGDDIQCHAWNKFEIIGNIHDNPELLKE